MPFLIFEPSPIPATSNRAPWRNSRERGRQARSRRSQPGPRGPCSGNVRARSAREFSPRSALGPARLVPARRRTVRASAQHPFWSPLPLHPTLSLSPRPSFCRGGGLQAPAFGSGAAVTTTASAQGTPAAAGRKAGSGGEKAAGGRASAGQARAPRRRDGGRAGWRAGGRASRPGRARDTYRFGSGGGGGVRGPGCGGCGRGRLLVVVARRWRPYLAAGSGQQSER